jgi:hypothetical protein
MLNENHNNSSYWKNKLEALDSLPEETLNKAAAWEKLHNRLRKDSNPNKVVWYRAAAACLLTAIVISLMFVHRKEKNLVKNDIHKSNISKAELKQAEPLKKEAIAVVSAVDGEKKRTVKNKIKNYNNKTIAAANKELLVTNNNHTSGKLIVLSVPVVDSAVVTTVGIVHAKKKLKVVHINELGDPVEASSEIAHHTDLYLFQLKLATQEVYDKSSVASNTTGIPSLKLKTSQN